ncbi:protein AF1q [Pygocentrus nattereri]|uniref:Protein AF1q n=1 Tax=Pygocentrus nattereri TaxID=42514 RepID=A0A3B4BRX4_PYGNA|nr:protein AF1q [Pygocentrus nattereri]
MLEVMSSQFDSFLFWRQPIPSLDLSELEVLGLSELVPKSSQMGKGGKSSVKSPPVDEDDDLDLSEFSTFNYWKEPIASIDVLDFNLLL